MGSVGATIVMIAALAGGQGLEPRVQPSEFRIWFDAATVNELKIPEGVESRARGFRYVFVGGLQSERMPGYFAQNIQELKAHGIPAKAIHEIYPNSHAPLSENLDAIRTAFHTIADLGPERLVIIAHSRGACDTLAFALLEPEFVREHVEALFLLQGPFGGSAVADYLMGEGTPIDSQMPVASRTLARIMGKLETSLVTRGWHGGMADLTREAAQNFWSKTLEECADAIPVVSPRTFYVESRIDPSRQSLLRKPIARYLDTYYGPNDGMVAAGDQSLPGLGLTLAVLDVGHTDLTHGFPAARRQRRLRRALIQSIIMLVGRTEPAIAVRAEASPLPDPADALCPDGTR